MAANLKKTGLLTIASRNYWGMVKTMVYSFKKFHPTTQVFVLGVDVARGESQFEDQEFHLVTVSDLNVKNFRSLAFQYNKIELNTALKPFFIEYIFKKKNVDRIIYLDPDILIFHRFTEVLRQLRRWEIILTPHITSSMVNNQSASVFLDFLKSGSYNLGFIAVKRSSEVLQFLRWWKEMTRRYCFSDLRDGVYTDQKWIDLVQSLFERVFVLRHHGYNVAYWNFHERKIEKKKGNRYVINNSSPLVFFHFSGLDIDKIDKISKEQNRYQLQTVNEHIKEIYLLYRELLLENRHRDYLHIPYRYDYFDNGDRILPFMREYYRSIYLNKDGNFLSFKDPFSTRERSGFYFIIHKSFWAPLLHWLFFLKRIVSGLIPKCSLITIKRVVRLLLSN